MTLPDLEHREDRQALEEALSVWLPQQRWFGGKARTVDAVRIADAFAVGDGDPPLLLALPDVTFTDGHHERYQVPLTPGTGPHALPGFALVDALADDAATLAFAHGLLGGQASATGSAARVRASRHTATSLDGAPRRLGVEQSNTSVVFGTVILKVFRRLEPGVNPDVEVTAALTELGFPHVPAQRGSAELIDDSDATALAVLADFLDGAREGWQLALEEVGAVVEAGSLEGAALLPLLGDLGRVVGRLHAALSDAFGATEATTAGVTDRVEEMRGQADRVLATARRLAPEDAAPVLERAEDIHDRLEALRAVDGGALVRIHGDLHLGQVLLDRSGTWQILDFEGEPVRSLAERRAPTFPLRDVAGMLRSFDYAAASVDRADAVPAVAARWREAARTHFLEGYRDAAVDAVLPGVDAVRAQLDAFELDKAVYELGYELANRPTWVPIPVGGIVRVLDRAPAGNPDHDATNRSGP